MELVLVHMHMGDGKTRMYTQHKMRPRPTLCHFQQFSQKHYLPTDGPTKGLTHPLIEMRGRI